MNQPPGGGKQRLSQVPIERVRTYWDSRPCNVRHSPRPIGTPEYFDEVERRKYFVEPHIPRFAEFERWKGKRVLEIGCGIGTDTISFARHGAQVTAVDLSAASLAIARQRAEVCGLASKIQFYLGDAETLAKIVEPQPYDLIYSFGVIHHTPHPKRVLDALQQFVDPATTLKIMIYHRRSWKVVATVLRHGHGKFWRTDELVARHSEAQTGCPVTFTYTRAEARKLFEGCGFRVTEMSVDHIFPYSVRAYVSYRYQKEWYFKPMPDPVFRWLETHFGWHLCITAKTRRMSRMERAVAGHSSGN
jgi:2-polyprenyl-3-methyl-5-hydroxy-6-metoxy-1,4-benzoquinol methylase